MGFGYRPDEVEALLQAGNYQGAVDAGWFGDEWAFRLVKTAAGHTLQSLEVAISPYDARTELGLDLRNDDGVATIGSIAPSGAVAGAHLQLDAGDVVRSVNGQALFTCEAIVRAIKNARGKPLLLGVVRPPPVVTWRDDAMLISAGRHFTLRFDVDAPGACLTYRWHAVSHDIGFHLVRCGSKSEGSSSRHQTPLAEMRQGGAAGHVRLVQPGRYMLSWDNSYSIFRAKHVRYLVRLVPLESWEAGSYVERLSLVERECATRKARSRELAKEVTDGEARIAALEDELGAVRAAVERALAERAENKERLQAAKAERRELLTYASPHAS
jgi:hypothetical protein